LYNMGKKSYSTTSSVIIVSAAIVVCIQIQLALLLQKFLVPANQPCPGDQASSNKTRDERPPLGDGCYHVFLDVGSNVGLHGRFLYEPQKYLKSTSSVKAFARVFGNERDNRDYCIFAFEPNPIFHQRHLQLEQAYKAMGWRYHPIFAGASNVNGNMTFHHTYQADNPKLAGQELGFSAVARYGDQYQSQSVPVLRLATWIIREIRNRKIPQSVYSKSQQSLLRADWNTPKVVMKLDVEGVEYVIFPDLLVTGALCDTIDFLMGEFHHDKRNHIMYPMNLTVDGKYKLNDQKEGETFASQMLRFVEITKANCKTAVSLEDDESYGSDPNPLPKPTL